MRIMLVTLTPSVEKRVLRLPRQEKVLRGKSNVTSFLHACLWSMKGFIHVKQFLLLLFTLFFVVHLCQPGP